jgi:hypothetical protein
MNKLILALFALPIVALSQGATNDYIFYQKPATGPLVVRPVTPTVGRLLGWPTSINTPAAITLGTGLSLSGSTLNATASSAWADITGKPTTLTGFGITDGQPLDADLTAIAGLTSAANKFPYFTGSGAAALADLSSAMRTFLTTASSANLRSLLTDEVGSSAAASGAGALAVFNNSPVFRDNLTLNDSNDATQGISLNKERLRFDNAGASGFSKTISIGNAAAANVTINLPSVDGTLITTGDTGTVTNTMLAGSIALSKLVTTGTPDNTTFLRGDGAWTAISSGATLAANTFTGLQQFSGTTHAGIRLNNLTTAERDALTGAAAGMAIWNTTDGRLQLHNGSSWTSGMVRLSGDTMTGALTVGLSALGTTPTAALSLTNSTAAAVGAQQVSPSLVLEGQGWKTTATAASQTVRFRQNVLPIQGAANPTGGWRLQSEINNSGTWADRLTVRTDGIDIANDYRIGLLADAIGISFRNYSAPSAIYFSVGAVSVLNIGSSQMSTTFNGFTVTQTNAANDVMQLGANTATASATAVAQTLKGPNATGTTSTGGSLTIAGGTGTSAGGAVIISTAATTTQTERARFSSAGVTIGASGTAIASVISATATLDFPSTNSHGASALTITVTGAAVGDVVALGIPTEAIGTNGVFFGYVSAADTVTVRFCNTDSGPAVNPDSGTFRATVIKH